MLCLNLLILSLRRFLNRILKHILDISTELDSRTTMSFFNIFVVLSFVGFFTFTHTAEDGMTLINNACGTWDLFATKKHVCLKFLDQGDTGYNYTIGQGSCRSHGGTMLTILNEQDQKFVEDFIRSKKIKTDLWLGLRYSINNHVWPNGKVMAYSNWGKTRPSNPNDYPCVAMLTGQFNLGKWIEADCNEKHVFLCERPMSPTEVVLDHLIQNLQTILQNIGNRMQKQDEKMGVITEELNKSVKDLDQKFDKKTEDMSQNFNQKTEEIVQEFDNKMQKMYVNVTVQALLRGMVFEKKIEDMAQNFNQKTEDIATTLDKKTEDMNQNFDQKIKDLDQKYDIKTGNMYENFSRIMKNIILIYNHNIDKINMDIENISQNMEKVTGDMKKIVPVGFIYIQFGDSAVPERLWPGTEWKDISLKYAGAFIKVLEGPSNPLGVVEESKFPDLKVMAKKDHYGGDGLITVPRDGQWTQGIITSMGSGGREAPHTLGFRWEFNVNQTVPKNMAVRVWKRIS